MAGKLTIDSSKIAGFAKVEYADFANLFGDAANQLKESPVVPRIRLQVGDVIELLDDVVNDDGKIYVGKTPFDNGKLVPHMLVKVTAKDRFIGYQVYNVSMLYNVPSGSYKYARQYVPIGRIAPLPEGAPDTEVTNKEIIQSLKKSMRFKVTAIYDEYEDGNKAPRRYQWAVL